MLVGPYLAAVAHWYNVTASASNNNATRRTAALAAISRTLDAFDLLSSAALTGADGYMARVAMPNNDSAFMAYVGPDSTTAHPGNSAPLINTTWLSSESRDQYLGALLGLSSTWALVREPIADPGVAAVRAHVAALVARFVDRLSKDWWFILSPPTIKLELPVNPTPFFICPWARLAIATNPAKYASKFKGVLSTMFTLAQDLDAWKLQGMWQSGYFSNNLDVISLYAYVAAEDAATPTNAARRGAVLGALRDMAVGVDAAKGGGAAHLSATFTGFWLAASRLAGEQDGDATNRTLAANMLEALLLDFPADKWDRAINQTTNPEYLPHNSAGGGDEFSEFALLPGDRPYDTFMWQRSPAQLVGGHNDTKQFQSIDFFLPYWLGRYAGALPGRTAVVVDGGSMQDCVPVGAPASPRSPRVRRPTASASTTPPTCQASFCAGPGRCYPTVGTNSVVDWYAEFDIPPLPKTFDPSTMTDYIYYNLFTGYGKDTDNPRYPSCLQKHGGPGCVGDGHGRFNQFVPQLMLGTALCNSTNAKVDPKTGLPYSPRWCHLDKWAIGAQYFFATFACPGQPNNHSSACPFSSFAATGSLIDVVEGETVYTRFSRSDEQWTLTMGVKGDRVPPSVVVATQPYMGLVPTTSSWSEDTYNTIYAGSCWELYGLSKATDYPPFMRYRHTMSASAAGADFWHPWGLDEGNNETSCRSVSLSSSVSDGERVQHVEVNATMHF